MNNEINFLMEEYSALRSEMLEQIKEAYAIEKYTAAGVLAALVWLLTNTAPNVSSIRVVAWSLPLIFVLLGLFRSLGLLSRMMAIAQHLKQTEDSFTKSGWEQSLRKDKARLNAVRLHDPSWRTANFPSLVSGMFWLLLLVGTGFTAQQCASTPQAGWCTQGQQTQPRQINPLSNSN